MKLIVDNITLDMINMCTLDYKIEMIRSSFEVIANPNAELGCSCGTSFSPKNMWKCYIFNSNRIKIVLYYFYQNTKATDL